LEDRHSQKWSPRREKLDTPCIRSSGDWKTNTFGSRVLNAKKLDTPFRGVLKIKKTGSSRMREAQHSMKSPKTSTHEAESQDVRILALLEDRHS
jgi:hypothetical protein